MKQILNKRATFESLVLTIITVIILQSCSKIEDLAASSNNGTQSSTDTITPIERPYVILISADGFRDDYPEIHGAPNLIKHSNEGVTAEYMLPSYPTLTQPNHYTLLTGLYPGHSGIVGSNFFQRRKDYSLIPFKPSQPYWFESSETIWQTAYNQNVLTANINWPMGKSILNSFPNNVLQYTIGQDAADDQNEELGNHVSIEEKISTVISWLGKPVAERPHLITIHFDEADHEGHTYGPLSPQVKSAVATIDSDVEKLYEAVKQLNLPVNFIFLSDHGMIENAAIGIGVQRRIDPSFKYVNLNSIVHLYATDPTRIDDEYRDFNGNKGDNYMVYKKADFPAHLFYSGTHDKYNRTGDIIIVPASGKSAKANPGKGMHGFDVNQVPQMRAIFRAWGPSFKDHYKAPPFENVEVYEIMTTILGLTPSSNDATSPDVKAMLK
jgi:predicted AlkP superfamily pyrophosphatase or phosphodiesterase